MARIWQIRQSDEPSRYGMDYRKHETDEVSEAYECGFEEGYEEAMRELRGFRSGYRKNTGYKDSEEPMEDDMNYRRRRMR